MQNHQPCTKEKLVMNWLAQQHCSLRAKRLHVRSNACMINSNNRCMGHVSEFCLCAWARTEQQNSFGKHAWSKKASSDFTIFLIVLRSMRSWKVHATTRTKNKEYLAGDKAATFLLLSPVRELYCCCLCPMFHEVAVCGNIFWTKFSLTNIIRLTGSLKGLFRRISTSSFFLHWGGTDQFTVISSSADSSFLCHFPRQSMGPRPTFPSSWHKKLGQNTPPQTDVYWLKVLSNKTLPNVHACDTCAKTTRRNVTTKKFDLDTTDEQDYCQITGLVQTFEAN